jgi:hypothetical protein
MILSFGQSAAKAVRDSAGAAKATEASDRKRRRFTVIVSLPKHGARPFPPARFFARA